MTNGFNEAKMIKLTAKQEAFACAVASGMNQSDAYRSAFDVNETTKDSSVNVNASKLMADAKIAQRVKEIREPIARSARITLESHLDDLLDLRKAAVENNQFSAAISAEVARAKAAGIQVDKMQITGADGGPVEHSLKVNFGD